MLLAVMEAYGTGALALQARLSIRSYWSLAPLKLALLRLGAERSERNVPPLVCLSSTRVCETTRSFSTDKLAVLSVLSVLWAPVFRIGARRRAHQFSNCSEHRRPHHTIATGLPSLAGRLPYSPSTTLLLYPTRPQRRTFRPIP